MTTVQILTLTVGFPLILASLALTLYGEHKAETVPFQKRGES